jgi:hypothetical protein
LGGSQAGVIDGIFSTSKFAKRGFMELKVLALSALCGVSLLATPAMAQSVGHITVTPIYCDESNCFDSSGAFSRYTPSANGHFLSFGEVEHCCSIWVGARIDTPGFPANNWQIVVNAPDGCPFFVTELAARDGARTFETTYGTRDSNGNVSASFNDAGNGQRFVAIWIYDAGMDCDEPFTDTLNLNHGVRVDGSFPAAVTRHFGINDCTGLNGNNNSSQ